MTRQRAPEIQSRKMVMCSQCEGRGVNKDYHPASIEITNCCGGCRGYGRVDESLGPLPFEQITQDFRNRLIQQKNLYKKDRDALAKILAAFDVLKKISDTPHPATQNHSRGHLGAVKAD